VAVFASGSGSNAEAIARHFAQSPLARVQLIVCNNPMAGVLDRANRLGIPAFLTGPTGTENLDDLQNRLRENNIGFIALAGWLRLVPNQLLSQFRGRIVNIHPALLPNFGGKGFYGHRVHEAVLAAAQSTSGITIHRVTEKYDEGEILFQKEVIVETTDTPESLAARIHTLEHACYTQIIEKEIRKITGSAPA